MGTYYKGAHVRYYLRYHVVWIVKYRRDLITDERGELIKKILTEIGERYEYTIEEVGTDRNHLHLLIGTNQNEMPSRVVNVLKSLSARHLLREDRTLRPELWGASLWGDGYYITTVGQSSFESAVKEYIRNQGKYSQHKSSEQMKLF